MVDPLIAEVINDFKHYLPLMKEEIDESIPEGLQQFITLIASNSISTYDEPHKYGKEPEGFKTFIVNRKGTKSIKIANINWLEFLLKIPDAVSTAVAFNVIGPWAVFFLLILLRDFLKASTINITKQHTEIILTLCLLSADNKKALPFSDIKKSLLKNYKRKYKKAKLVELIEELTQLKVIIYDKEKSKLYLNESVWIRR